MKHLGKLASAVFFGLITFGWVFTACAPVQELETLEELTATEKPTSTHTQTPEPSATATSTATLTPTSEPISGKLFFDMNGSGLQDEASFYYDPERIEDERQPLQPDILDAVNVYLNGHPDIMKGDLITITEPGLSDFSVCYNEECFTTDARGNFEIANAGSKVSISITIIDPFKDSRAMQMRYINKWNGPVTIPAYEMNGYKVPEQSLNDTTVYDLSTAIAINRNSSVEIGLMQGYLTLPYSIEYAFDFGIGTFYDLDTRTGSVRNYAGSTYMIYDPGLSVGLGGTGDSHIGIDYEGPEGLFVIDPMGGQINGIYFNDSQLVVTGEDPGNSGYVESYGHLKTVLVNVREDIYRGQITSINGMTNTSHPHIHYNFNTNLRQYESRDDSIDPYMDLVETNPYWVLSTSIWSGEVSEIMIGSPGYFTVVNMPIFP